MAHSLLSPLIILISTATLTHAQSCGADCKSCTDLPTCDADPNCFYLVDIAINGCRRANTCESDCSLCTDEASCATGAGGLCLYNLGTGECFGSTCDTDCQNCDANNCANSRSPPFGCSLDDVEESCVPKLAPTPNPTLSPEMTPTTTTTPAPVPVMTRMPTNPVITVTSDMFTTDSSDSSSIDSTSDSLSSDSSSSDSMETTDFIKTTDDSSSDSSSSLSDSMETTGGGILPPKVDSDSSVSDGSVSDDSSDSSVSGVDDDKIGIDSDASASVDSIDSVATNADDDDIDSAGGVVKVDSSDSSDTKTNSVSIGADSGDGVPAVVSVSDSNDDGVALPAVVSVDSISVDSGSNSDSGGDLATSEAPSADQAIDIDSGDDDANTMRHSGGIAQRKGSGRTNIGGVVLAICGILIFLAVSSGIWCFYKSKNAAFVSLKAIDVEENEYANAQTVQEEDEQTVMMTVVTDGPQVTACSDEDIL